MTERQTRSAEDIATWLAAEIARLKGVSKDAVDFDAALTDHLTDSRDALSLAANLQDWLGYEVSIYVVWDHPTLAALAAHLAAAPQGEGARGHG